MDRKRIIVVGGGFAGLNFIKKVDRKRFDVTLVDANNYHSFPPLFYQLASAGLDAASINFPLRREMRSGHARGCHYRLGRVKTINVHKHTITTQFETLEYDYLVLAAGSTNNFFGIPDLQKYVYTLKSTAEAIRCRNDILDRLERAALVQDPVTRRKMLTFTIIGGGPTGVEIAGAIGELKRYIMPREYPGIDQNDVSVTLVEGSKRLLGAMSEKSSERVVTDLEQLMVKVELGKTMKSYDADGMITYADGSTHYSSMVIWTAGVTGVDFHFEGTEEYLSEDKSIYGPGHRIPVDEFNRMVGIPDVFVVGDLALHTSDRYPKGHPQVAQVAIQSARTLAENLNAGEWNKPFVYKDKGSMATVGRNRALVDMNHVHLNGRIAWLAWMAVHLMSLLGMRNKITVFVTWMWAYFTYSSSTRLLLKITRWPRRPEFPDIYDTKTGH